MEDEDTSVAPPRRTAISALSAEAVPAISFAEAIPALSAEAIPALSADAVPALSAEAVPAILSAEASPTTTPPADDPVLEDILSAEASPATTPPADDPVLEDIHPQGSSRATGGILRGRAAASYYSPADEENTMFNSIGNAKLIAKIFTSTLDPLNLNHDTMVPSSKVTIKMNPNLGPILENISLRYPLIKVAPMILIYDINDGLWESKGTFQTATEDNDDLTIQPNNDGKFNLDILCSYFDASLSISAIPTAVHNRMISLQAAPIASGSGSGSASSADSRSQSVFTTTVEESSSSRKPFTAHELELIEALDIPMRLTREVPGKSLRDFWERYQAGLAAISKRTKLQTKPTEQTITNIFIGKSQWFNWNKVFIKVKTYNDMIKWLNRDENSKGDVDVWKCELDDYNLENLKMWLDNGGKLVDKGKGKGKAGAEEDKKKKKKKKE